MALNQNQFSQIRVQGEMTARINPDIESCEIDVSSGGSLVAGQAVKVVNSAGGAIKVVECAADSDDVYGFIVYDMKHQTFNAFDRVEIATGVGNVMYMTASAAIARNAKVAIVVSGSKVVTATTGQTIVGRALDKAAANGDLIRVKTAILLGTQA